MSELEFAPTSLQEITSYAAHYTFSSPLAIAFTDHIFTDEKVQVRSLSISVEVVTSHQPSDPADEGTFVDITVKGEGWVISPRTKKVTKTGKTFYLGIRDREMVENKWINDLVIPLVAKVAS